MSYEYSLNSLQSFYDEIKETFERIYKSVEPADATIDITINGYIQNKRIKLTDNVNYNNCIDSSLTCFLDEYDGENKLDFDEFNAQFFGIMRCFKECEELKNADFLEIIGEWTENAPYRSLRLHTLKVEFNDFDDFVFQVERL